jgi:hypothetical protein
LLVGVLSGHSLVAAIVAGAVTGIAMLVAMMRYQQAAWRRAAATPLFTSKSQPQ